MKREGSLHRRVGTCQRILALQVIPLGVSNYLVIFLIIVITVCLLSSLPCLQFLLLLFPLDLLRLFSTTQPRCDSPPP